MDKFAKIMHHIEKDVAIAVADLFDKNFKDKKFFTTPWPQRKFNPSDNLLLVTGDLRRSINKPSVGNGKIMFTSSLPYANIHNNGGIIIVTQKMKGYFWHLYKLHSDKSNIYSTKSQRKRNTKATRADGAKAEFYKFMALKKVGSQIKIPQRQFIGNHPTVDAVIKQQFDKGLDDVDRHFKNILNNK